MITPAQEPAQETPRDLLADAFRDILRAGRHSRHLRPKTHADQVWEREHDKEGRDFDRR